MLTSTLPRFLGLLSIAVLTACGSNVDTTRATTALAANISHMPVADCEPQACRGLRIIDSNAETFRADNARRDALAAMVAQQDGRPDH